MREDLVARVEKNRKLEIENGELMKDRKEILT